MPDKRLTLFILIALVLGIGVGYFYNLSVIKPFNDKIAHARSALVKTRGAIAFRDTTLSHQIAAIESLRDKKLRGFTLLSDFFLRLIKFIVAPLVFTSLVAGVARVDGVKSVGRIGVKTLLWFLGATLISLLLGMLMVNLFQPGAGVHFDGAPGGAPLASNLSLKDFIGHIIPQNFFAALAGGQILPVVVMALVFGIALVTAGPKALPLVAFFEAVVKVLLQITRYIMLLAPLAVFGAMAAIVAKQGLAILSVYLAFIGEFYISLLLLWLLIISAGYGVIGKKAFALVACIKDAMLTAFGTTASEAAYPKLYDELARFGCDSKIISFVLPLGYSFNLDGGMMYMTFASLFIAQACGVHLPLSQQLAMLLMLMLASKGVAGVPRAALVIVAATISQFNIPAAGFALVVGIDPLLDMGRSATNVLGNAIATAVVDKWEAGKINIR